MTNDEFYEWYFNKISQSTIDYFQKMLPRMVASIQNQFKDLKMTAKVNYTVKIFVSYVGYVTTVKVGQQFDIVLFVKDLRPNGTYFNPYYGQTMNKVRGVFAGYADILYNKSLTAVDYSKITHSATYPNDISGFEGVDRIDEFGGFAQSFSGLGTGLLEVGRVHATAKAVGTQIFTPDFNQIQHPRHDTLVYGNIACDPPEQSYVDITEISITPASLVITQ